MTISIDLDTCMTTFEILCLFILTHGAHAVISALIHNVKNNTEETVYGVVGIACCLISGCAFLTSIFT